MSRDRRPSSGTQVNSMPSAKLQTPRRQRHGKKVAAKATRSKRVRAAATQREAVPETRGVIAYHSAKGVDEYVRQVARARSLQTHGNSFLAHLHDPRDPQGHGGKEGCGW